MAEQMGRSMSNASSGCGESAGGDSRGPAGDQGSFAEVTVIDSQFQHFSSYIEVIRVFKCRLCTFCSPLEHVIASHMSEVHFPRRCFLCKQCLFVFEDRAQLVSHLDSAHGTKSIAVCFGDVPSAGSSYSSPPTLRMMMRSAEGEDRIQEQMMEETSGEEALNGRVTSSTGNLANLTSMVRTSPTQPDCVELTAMETCVIQNESGRATEPPSVPTDARQEQSRSSSCHPSSSNQVYSSPDVNDCEAPNPRHEQPETQRNDQEPLPAGSRSLVSDLQVRVGSQSYIKTEPISPVRSSLTKQGQRARPYLGRSRHDPRSYMRRWSLTENLMNEDSIVNIPERMSRSFDTPGSENLLPNCTEEGEKTNSKEDFRSENVPNSTPVSKEAENVSGCKEGGSASSQSVKESSDTETKEKLVENSKSLDTGKGTEKGILLGVGRSYHSGRSVDGRPPRLVRQSVVQESPRNSPQLEVLSEENSISGERKEVPAVTNPCSPAEAMRRENFSRSFPGSFGKSLGDLHAHQRSVDFSANFRPSLRDLVSSRMERRDKALPPSAAEGLCGPFHNTSLPAGRANTALLQSGRIRSYSIGEGDSQGKNIHLSKLTDADMGTAATERDHPSSMHPRMPPGNPHMPHTLHHPCSGLVYQPYSIEGEPKHMRYYSQGPRMASPSAMDGAPHSLHLRQENGQFPPQNQPTEESFLYRYLRNNGGLKYRRNSVSGGNLASGEAQSARLVPAHTAPPRGMVPHVEAPEIIGIDRQRGLPLPPRHHLEHPFPQQGSFPPHMTPYGMMWKDKFEGSQVSPNASDQGQGPEYGGSLEKDASSRGEVLNSPNGVVLIDGKLVRAKQGEGGESNQDLAKDITRQVQQAMGVTQALYTPGDRHLISWVEGSEPPNSPDDVDGEALGQRRSRKSTFNIYREIPERKRKLDHEEEEKIKHSYNADGSFDYFTLTGWKAYKCEMCKKRRFKTASELQEHKQRKHGLQRNHSSQGSLNGLPEAASALTVADGNEGNDSPASG